MNNEYKGGKIGKRKEDGWLLNFLRPCKCVLESIREEIKEMNMKLSEAIVELNAIGNQLTKAQAEILKKIDDLQVALQDVEIPAEAQAALDALKQNAQALDDIVPDQI